ncbi:NAD(P)-dependent dehydrogenase, short-chain alcohol dehydrogenase family [Lentibacillus halodurans]|uniref:NAD(P)-dependent dehydrogenase, short-chain alcohol dehydrogenase family n=1 Tax=Lentibacillus halodurans TaxID=237679 RepID=A0A1I1ABQ0_9BACI|nr:2,4-dienoyl-CoA reductase [Lentibacillus halodurans]SFB35407.1 NAD(P)-dependent dehydrogenase, short-chain alcohol dehydrogenase family [Lentibacillus halodurans]
MINKTVIVTGASSGMGKYMAAKFAEEGANVVITGRNEDRLQTTREELEKSSQGNLYPISMDVRKPEDVTQLVTKTIDQYGTIDHLVNNAAGNFIAPAEDLSVNGWNAVIDIVLNGTFYCSRQVGKHWIDNGINGSILNIVATYAWNAGAGVAHSSAAKAGVLNLTRTLAVERGTKYGIRVNAIAPGPIERTGGADKLFQSEEAVKRTVNSVPLKRLGKPEEIAGLAHFLLSEKAAYINGEVVTMDGGQWFNPFPF